MDKKLFNLYKRGIYLYTFREGCPVRLYFGNLYKDKCHFGRLTHCIFNEKVGELGAYRCNTSLEEGVLHRNTVWMRERNDERALEVYSKHVEEVIKKHIKTATNIKEEFESLCKRPVEICFKEN